MIIESQTVARGGGGGVVPKSLFPREIQRNTFGIHSDPLAVISGWSNLSGSMRPGGRVRCMICLCFVSVLYVDRPKPRVVSGDRI